MDYSYLPAGGSFAEGGSEYKMTCPDCGHGNFFWNLQKLLGSCFNCGKKVLGLGQFSRVFKTVSVLEETRSQTALKERAGKDLVKITDDEAMPALFYLSSRGVDYGLAQKAGLRYSPSQQRVYCPIWSPLNGFPPSWKSRSILPGYKGWMGEAGDKAKHYLFGNRFSLSDPVIVLVEGVFDVLSPGLWGRALSLLGSSLSREIEYWLGEKFRHVVLWLDPDHAGVTKSRGIAERLAGWGIAVTNLSGLHPEPGSVSRSYAHDLLGRCL